MEGCQSFGIDPRSHKDGSRDVFIYQINLPQPPHPISAVVKVMARIPR
jgi:hypothetical protein